jgi:hypothetical protein
MYSPLFLEKKPLFYLYVFSLLPFPRKKLYVFLFNEKKTDFVTTLKWPIINTNRGNRNLLGPLS